LLSRGAESLDAGSIEIANDIHVSEFRAEALRQVAIAQLSKRDEMAAKATLALALDSAVGVSARDYKQIELFRDIAEIQARAGDIESAKRTFRRALAVTKGEDGEPFIRGELCRQIAKAESRAGLVTDATEWARALPSAAVRAAALLGVAQGLVAPDRPDGE
jgi:hypothetical protein